MAASPGTEFAAHYFNRAGVPLTKMARTKAFSQFAEPSSVWRFQVSCAPDGQVAGKIRFFLLTDEARCRCVHGSLQAQQFLPCIQNRNPNYARRALGRKEAYRLRAQCYRRKSMAGRPHHIR